MDLGRPVVDNLQLVLCFFSHFSAFRFVRLRSRLVGRLILKWIFNPTAV